MLLLRLLLLQTCITTVTNTNATTKNINFQYNKYYPQLVLALPQLLLSQQLLLQSLQDITPQVAALPLTLHHPTPLLTLQLLLLQQLQQLAIFMISVGKQRANIDISNGIADAFLVFMSIVLARYEYTPADYYFL